MNADDRAILSDNVRRDVSPFSPLALILLNQRLSRLQSIARRIREIRSETDEQRERRVFSWMQ